MIAAYPVVIGEVTLLLRARKAAAEHRAYDVGLRMAAIGTKPTWPDVRVESAFRVRAEVKFRRYQAGNNFRARFPIKLLE